MTSSWPQDTASHGTTVSIGYTPAGTRRHVCGRLQSFHTFTRPSCRGPKLGWATGRSLSPVQRCETLHSVE